MNLSLTTKKKKQASKRSILLSEEEQSDRRSSSSADSTNKQRKVTDAKCQRTIKKNVRKDWNDDLYFVDCQPSTSSSDDESCDKTSPTDSSESDPAWTPYEAQVDSPSPPKLTANRKKYKTRGKKSYEHQQLSSLPLLEPIYNSCEKEDEEESFPILPKLTELTKETRINRKMYRNPPHLKAESLSDDQYLSPPELIPLIEKRSKKGNKKAKSNPKEELSTQDFGKASPSDTQNLPEKASAIKKEKKRNSGEVRIDVSQQVATVPAQDEAPEVIKNLRASTEVPTMDEKKSSTNEEAREDIPANSKAKGYVEFISPSFAGIVSYSASGLLEKGFDSGRFIMLKSDFKTQKNPCIWRIDGKNLLQKYEPISYNEGTAYRNISTYSSWMATNKGLYVPIQVDFSVQSKSETIVTFDRSNVVLPVEDELLSALNDEANTMMDTFQIYLQTLMSQALDSNFLKEIVKEQDDYFLTSMAIIEDHWILPKRNLLKEIIKMKKNFQELLEAHPILELRCVTSGDKSCDSCGGRNPTRSFEFQPLTYDSESLDVVEAKSSPKAYRLCLPCTDRVLLYHQLFHMRFNLFTFCQNKVNQYEQCDGPAALTASLADHHWKSLMHRKVLLILAESQQVVNQHATTASSV